MKKKLKNGISTWGQLRFSIIGGLLASPPPKGELQEALKELACQTYVHPIKDIPITFGFSTIERWYYRAQQSEDPVAALSRKVRCDADQCKAICSILSLQLHRQYKAYSHWSYKLHADNLAAWVELEKPESVTIPSYSTVRRYMKRHGWNKKRSRKTMTKGQKKAADRLEQREVRSYESEFVHGLWHLDFHQGKRRVVDANGRWRTPIALCILDDCSRLCCHIQWYFAETAENLIHGLTQAFYKRGRPRSLLTDNGAAMIAGETQSGLLRLSVKHYRTLSHSPYQNGKLEVLWGQVEGRLMAMLKQVDPLTLKFLNDATQAWVEQEYNRSNHEEINTTPLERMLAGPNVSQSCPVSETLRLAFSLEESRIQRKSDGTVQIKGVRFEIPSQFRHVEKLHLRYQHWDLSTASLVDVRTGDLLTHIKPQDKVKNANGARRALEQEQDVPQEKTDTDPVPPLLKKLLNEYAATGVPPGYIQKDDHQCDDKQEGIHD